jgi:hypothetical protein
MIKDIVENTQLFALGAWNSVVELVAPQPAKREAIRVGMSRLNQARDKYRELDNLLKQEEIVLDLSHMQERKHLADRQKDENTAMRERHSAARGQAKEGVRQVRTMVLSDIVNAKTAEVASPSEALPLAS